MIYASGIKGKAGISPDNLADDLGPLFESILRCIPEPSINKDGALQMLVSGCYSFIYMNLFVEYLLGYNHLLIFLVFGSGIPFWFF